ncbi:thioredoxin family protein [Laceyella putida]|uniref:Thioredoxin n=1 Tax=Laceyella putida TaxID=110101 RepID=A0ABW2RG38_9BACL
MQKINQDSFADFITEGKKVVEFSADWCVDCKRVAPDMPELAQKFADQFVFAEIDVDEARTVAEQYGVKGIPTFVVFENGKEIGRLPSRFAKTKDQIEAFLQEHVSTEKI